METYRFNIRNVASLNLFHDRIDDIIKGCKIAACEIDNRVDKRPKAIEEAYSGKYIKFNKDKVTFYLWFGIFTATFLDKDCDNICDNIYISLSKEENPEIFDIVSTPEKVTEEYFFTYIDEIYYWFELNDGYSGKDDYCGKDDYYGKLRNDEVDDEKKYRIIDAYFNEVIAYILSKDYRNKNNST